MKILKYFILLFIALTIEINANNLYLKKEIKTGLYIPGNIVTYKNLRRLPIPISNRDYAFIQSIEKVTNIVIGHFKTGTPSIKLITDNNADGKVDRIYVWYPDRRKLTKVTHPEKEISKAEFLSMKEQIINGNQKTYTPNIEGIKYIKRTLDKYPDIIKVIKAKNGYRTTVVDVDHRKTVRADFVISDSLNLGVDISFEVKYRHRGNLTLKPIIPITVYANKSEDPYLKKRVREMLEYLKEYSIN